MAPDLTIPAAASAGASRPVRSPSSPPASETADPDALRAELLELSRLVREARDDSDHGSAPALLRRIDRLQRWLDGFPAGPLHAWVAGLRREVQSLTVPAAGLLVAADLLGRVREIA